MRYRESLQRAGSGVPHTAQLTEVGGTAAAVWLDNKQAFPPSPFRPRWVVVFGKSPGLPLGFFFIAPDGSVREEPFGWPGSRVVSVEEAGRVYAAFVRAVSEKTLREFPVIKAAIAMYNGSGGGIGDLKRAAKKLL